MDTEFTVKRYEILAEESNGDRYKFEAHVLPNGVAVVINEAAADVWYDSLDLVEAHGNAQVIGIVPDGAYVSALSIWRESFAASVGEFGLAATGRGLSGLPR